MALFEKIDLIKIVLGENNIRKIDVDLGIEERSQV